MLWFTLALTSALTMSASDVLSKRLSRRVSDFTNVWIRFFYAAPFMLLVLLLIDRPPLDGVFWLALAALLPLEITAWFLYLKAIRLSPLGLTIPFLGLTPVLLLVVPRLLLGEQVSALGAVGVFTVALGVYLLNVGRTSEGWWGPLAAIRSEPGSKLMIVVAALFSGLAEQSISVDMIIQSPSRKGDNTTDVTFTVPKTDLPRCKGFIEQSARELGAASVEYDTDIVKVSIVGLGMRSHAGVAAKMFELLSEENINIHAISTSEIKISCIIEAKYVELAVRALHAGFGLDRAPGASSPPPAG